MVTPLISMLGITKKFPGVIANNKIDLELYPGEVHALLGENGSGKSTLMSILTGLYQPTEGKILVDGKETQFSSPADAISRGIGMALVFGVSVCLYSQFLPDTLTGIFTRDSEVVQMASGYLRGYSIDCIMVSFVFCINAYFSGQGNSVFPMVHSVISTFLFRIPLSYSFSLVSSSSLFLMGFAPPLSTLVSLMICIGYMRYKRKKEIIPVYA